MAETPPGLLEEQINALRRELPRGRGMVRVDRYYQKNDATHVVYDVLDEYGHRILDKQNRITRIDVEFPKGAVHVSPGTVFRFG